MFRGSIPTLVSKLADEHIASWTAKACYVGCSGSFTVERHLADYPRFEVHSNDVLLYSAAIGGHYCGHPYPLTLTEKGLAEIGWVEPYLSTSEDALATLLLVSKFAITLGRKDEGRSDRDNPYYVRLRDAYRKQWGHVHARTVATVRGSKMRLASYTSEDVVSWIDRVPRDAALIAYPPFQASGASTYFARDFGRMEQMFQWEEPAYTPLEGDALFKLYATIADRREWLFATNADVPELGEFLRAKVHASNRSPHIRLYGGTGPRRSVQPHQLTEPLRVRHLAPGARLGARCTVHPITRPQFYAARSLYMNHGIRPGSADLPFVVCVDGVIVGYFAYNVDLPYDGVSVLPPPNAYMLSDFPVKGTDYPRLSKLVVMVAISSEVQFLLRRASSKSFRSMTTTAISNFPASAKYARGAGLHLIKRTENKSLSKAWGAHIPAEDSYYSRPYDLLYGAPLGQWSAQEGYELWLRKHGKVAAATAGGTGGED